jgi:hypothetical protein
LVISLSVVTSACVPQGGARKTVSLDSSQSMAIALSESYWQGVRSCAGFRTPAMTEPLYALDGRDALE